jgi:hypothetical protein
VVGQYTNGDELTIWRDGHIRGQASAVKMLLMSDMLRVWRGLNCRRGRRWRGVKRRRGPRREAMVVVHCMDPMPASGKAGYSRRGALREVRRLTARDYCRHNWALVGFGGGFAAQQAMQVGCNWLTRAVHHSCYGAKPSLWYSGRSYIEGAIIGADTDSRGGGFRVRRARDPCCVSAIASDGGVS